MEIIFFFETNFPFLLSAKVPVALLEFRRRSAVLDKFTC